MRPLYDDDQDQVIATTDQDQDHPAPESEEQSLPPGRVTGASPHHQSQSRRRPWARAGFTQTHFRHTVAAARAVDNQFPVIEEIRKFCNEDAMQAGVSCVGVSWQHCSRLAVAGQLRGTSPAISTAQWQAIVQLFGVNPDAAVDVAFAPQIDFVHVSLTDGL